MHGKSFMEITAPLNRCHEDTKATKKARRFYRVCCIAIRRYAATRCSAVKLRRVLRVRAFSCSAVSAVSALNVVTWASIVSHYLPHDRSSRFAVLGIRVNGREDPIVHTEVRMTHVRAFDGF